MKISLVFALVVAALLIADCSGGCNVPQVQAQLNVCLSLCGTIQAILQNILGLLGGVLGIVGNTVQCILNNLLQIQTILSDCQKQIGSGQCPKELCPSLLSLKAQVTAISTDKLGSSPQCGQIVSTKANCLKIIAAITAGVCV